MSVPGARRNERNWFESLPHVSRHKDFLYDVVKLLIEEAVFEGTKRFEPVVRYRDPEHLKQLINFKTSDKAMEHKELLQLICETVKYSVKTGHPYFVNQLFSCVDTYGLVGQWVTDALNPSVYTYEVAPVFSLMEDVVLGEMRKLVGFPEGDGVFCPGGSMANGIAVNVARYYMFPEVKKTGIQNIPQLQLYASQDAHYSVHKMAALLGLGEDNVILVQTDNKGQMNTQNLEFQIQSSLVEHTVPFMVIATSGTTVLGAFDPLHEISKICKKYGLWLHVDAAWGGGLLFSQTYKHKLNGIDSAHSVAWNPHKLLAVPQQCSVLLVRYPHILSECHSRHASYLFQKDKFYDTTYDTGDKYVQCGRRADVFKFWFMWKAKGDSGFEKHVDTLMDRASYLTSAIRKHPAFKLVIEPSFVNVCFWYIPLKLRGREYELGYEKSLHKVAPKMKERMMKRGSMMINYQPMNEWPNFFRFVTQNSGLTRDDIDILVNEMDVLGQDL